jgi:hypothetical protein
MFNTDLSFEPVAAPIDGSNNYCELNRLLSAAIVSSNFRNLLINNPESALAKGYQGEKFNLSNEDYHWLVSIEATDLPNFASQLLEYQNTRKPANEIAFAVKIPAMSRVGYKDAKDMDWRLG